MEDLTTIGSSLLDNAAGLLTPRLTTPEQDKGDRETGAVTTREETHHFASSFSLRIVCMGGWNTTLKFLGLGGSDGPKPQSPKQPTTLLISTEGREGALRAGREEVQLRLRVTL